MRVLAALVLAPAMLTASDFAIDHVTVAGADMQRMQAALSAAGIPSVYGGPHSDGVTAMAMVSLPDGSYLELIALQPSASAAAIGRHVWGRYLRDDAGPTAWALREENMAAEVRRLRAAGVSVSEPEANGRKRPDGAQLQWETSTPGTEPRGTFFPFLIHDFTPRDERAFPQGKPVNSDLRGLAAVVIGVRNVDAAAERYLRAFGLAGAVKALDREFGAELAALPGTPVILAQPLTNDSWLAERLAQFGEVPCAFVLSAAHPAQYRTSSGSRWFGKQISWFDPKILGWRLGIETVQ